MLSLLLFSLLSSPAPSAEPLCDIAVHTEDVDFEEFEAAVALRLPGIRFREASTESDPECASEAHGFVELRRRGPQRWELRLILSDGRAWYRPVEAAPEQAARLLATTLANMMMAVEDPSIEPDERGVPLPDIEAADEPPASEADPSQEPQPDADRSDASDTNSSLPQLEVEDAGSVDVDEGPSPDVEPESEPETPSPDTQVAPALLELGPRIGGQFVLGLTPSGGLRGGGGSLALDLRMPKGATVELGVRELVGRSSGLTLLRTRVELGGGWTPRTGMFEAPFTLKVAVEHWAVRWSGPPPSRPPLIGGGVRFAPGLRFDTGPVTMRLALGLGLDLSVEASGANGLSVPALTPEAGAPAVIRAGGVELAAGLEIGVWIPVRQRDGGR